MRECGIASDFIFGKCLKHVFVFRETRPVRDASGARGRGGGRGERGRGVDRGKRGHNSHLVQTQGLFSEGAGALNVKRQISRGKESSFGFRVNFFHFPFL